MRAISVRSRLLVLSALAIVLAAACSSGAASTRSTSAPATSAAEATAVSPAAVAALTPAPTPTTPVAGAASPAAGGATADAGERALAHVRVLAGDIGARPAASPEERRAAEYIAGQLRQDGYDVSFQEFPISTFVARSTSFHVDAPAPEDVRVAPLTNSPAGKASSRVFDGGYGHPEDFPAGGIAGQVAFVRRGQVAFGDMARAAAAAGASALVVWEKDAAIVPGRLSGTLPDIPAVSIPGADGERLALASHSGTVRVSIAFDGGVVQGAATNVIARPAGGDCRAVVGGHYDSVAIAPGASDNASGTSVVLEIAREQALRGNPEHACFIAFSGEELGLLGSQYFLDKLSDSERTNIRFMLNFDMNAVGDDWWLVGSRTLQAKGHAIAAANGVEATAHDLVGASSDHASFIDRHIPSLLLIRWDDRQIHTPQDTVDRITAPPLAEAVRVGLAFLAGFAEG